MADFEKIKYFCVVGECDPVVRNAINEFFSGWEGFSVSSRKKPLFSLIRDVIDDSIKSYWASVSEVQVLYHYGYDRPFSVVCYEVGFDRMSQIIRDCVRDMVLDNDYSKNQVHIDTLESLVYLCYECADKKASKKTRPGEGINLQRGGRFCRYCGNLSEFAMYYQGLLDVGDKKARLSSRYCHEHKPRFPSGAWNIKYKRVRNNQNVFDLELARLYRQGAKPEFPSSGSGNDLIDRYFFCLINQHINLPPVHAEIRNLARCMVDERLTDRKKEIAILMRAGLSQADVGRMLGIKPQTVHKLVASLSRLSPILRLDKP